MTEIKQVNVGVCSLSFYFFLSPNKWVLEQGGAGKGFFWRKEDDVITL